MPWIQNVSRTDIKNGYHIEPGPNAMLIQICDPPGDFPIPKYKFKEVHQFDFLDIEKEDFALEEEMRCTQEQANEIAKLLTHALANHMNVVVHCTAGVSRSGAVCEVGTILGFKDTEVFRSPNLLVKHRIMKALGLPYNEHEPHTINGVAIPEEWANDNEKVFTLAKARKERREREGEK